MQQSFNYSYMNGGKKPRISVVSVIPEDMDKFAYAIKKQVKNKDVLFLNVDYSGKRDFRYLIAPLKDAKINFEFQMIEQDASDQTFYRQITTPYEKIAEKDAKILIPFENSVREGRGITGALLWCLYGIRDGRFPDAETVYTASMIDELGISHFSVFPNYAKFINPLDYVSMKNPGVFEEFKKDGLIKYVSSYIPNGIARKSEKAEPSIASIEQIKKVK